MTRVAAYDCGTNSLRLLVADLDPASGTATEIYRDMRIVRLGEGVDRTGTLAPAALERTLAAIDEFAAVAARHGADRTVFAATSAARDADNSETFMAEATARTGAEPEVLTGDQEARMSFSGAVRSADGPAPYLVVDIGGGSTECILGTVGGSGPVVQAAQSLDIGSVRLTERHLSGDPPTAGEVEAAIADIEQALDSLDLDLATAATVIGVAGTVTTIAAGALGLTTYQRDVIHHSTIEVTRVRAQVDQLLAMSVEQRLGLGYLHPGRADVIAGGGLILDRLLRRTAVDALLVSEHDILDGLAWSAVAAT